MALLIGAPALAQDEATIKLHRAQSLGAQEEALRVAAEALQLYPQNASLQRTAAGVYSSQDQYAAAIGSQRRSLELEPAHPGAYANIGGLFTAV
jgi:tetratricopeptide (TPR) repeat protein